MWVSEQDNYIIYFLFLKKTTHLSTIQPPQVHYWYYSCFSTMNSVFHYIIISNMQITLNGLLERWMPSVVYIKQYTMGAWCSFPNNFWTKAAVESYSNTKIIKFINWKLIPFIVLYHHGWILGWGINYWRSDWCWTFAREMVSWKRWLLP